MGKNEETYEAGEACLSFDGATLKDAQVVEVDEEREQPYLVHFKGWHSRYDRWVGLPYLCKRTPDNLEYQKELAATAKTQKAAATTESKLRTDVAKETNKPPAKRAKQASSAQQPEQRKEVPHILHALLDSIVEDKADPNMSTERVFTNELRKLFKQFDVDHNGTIDKQELANILRAMGKRASKKRLDAVFEALDVDGDGSIDFDEFVKYFKSDDTGLDTRLYCTCNSLSTGFMVACDGGFNGCKEWYHGKCLGIKNASEVKGVWFCATCLAQASQVAQSKYRSIKGIKYDKAMLDYADSAMAEHGKIDLAAVKGLVADAVSDHRYTKIERRTMIYMRKHDETYKMTRPAHTWICKAIASWRTAGRGPKRKKQVVVKTETPKASAATKAVALETVQSVLAGSAKPQGSSDKFIKRLRKVFRFFDKDNSNSIDREEVRAVMRCLGLRPTSDKVDAMFDVMDANGDGSIDFSEFCKYFAETDVEVDKTPYCSCQQPSDGRFMICCDAELPNCAQWYHGACVGLAEGNFPDVWFCPLCKEQLAAVAKAAAEAVMLANPDADPATAAAAAASLAAAAVAPPNIAQPAAAAAAAAYSETPARTDSPAYQPLVSAVPRVRRVNRAKLDDGMLTIAETAMRTKGIIGIEDARALVANVLDDNKYTKIEKRTMKFLRDQVAFQFSPQADAWIRSEVASWASRIGHETREDRDLADEANKRHKTVAVSSKSEADIKAEMVAWFGNHKHARIHALETLVASLSSHQVLARSKAQWQASVTSPLATAAIIGFLSQYR